MCVFYQYAAVVIIMHLTQPSCSLHKLYTQLTALYLGIGILALYRIYRRSLRRKSMRIQLTALVLAILLPLGAVQAAESNDKPEQRLNLTQEQREQMQEMRQANREEQQKLRQQTWEKLPKKERDAYDKQREQMREKNRAQMRALLTPEQQVVFDKMSAQQLERQAQGKGLKDKGWKGKHHERPGDKK